LTTASITSTLGDLRLMNAAPPTTSGLPSPSPSRRPPQSATNSAYKALVCIFLSAETTENWIVPTDLATYTSTRPRAVPRDPTVGHPADCSSSTR